jgi:hypothetical protein
MNAAKNMLSVADQTESIMSTNSPATQLERLTYWKYFAKLLNVFVNSYHIDLDLVKDEEEMLEDANLRKHVYSVLREVQGETFRKLGVPSRGHGEAVMETRRREREQKAEEERKAKENLAKAAEEKNKLDDNVAFRNLLERVNDALNMFVMGECPAEFYNPYAESMYKLIEEKKKKKNIDPDLLRKYEEAAKKRDNIFDPFQVRAESPAEAVRKAKRSVQRQRNRRS